MNIKKGGTASRVLEALIMVSGSAIFAFSFVCFMLPNKIVPGGAIGVAAIINYISGVPVGVALLLLNLPLFILGYKYIGGRFIAQTILCSVVISVAVDIMELFITPLTRDPLLGCLYGGLISGIGLGLIFLHGATTGGSDIAGRLLQLKYKHLTMGRLLLIVDVTVVVLAALVYGKVESALYSIITLYVRARAIDAILYGMNYAKVAYIISDKIDEIAQLINRELGRGATYLTGEGVYTRRQKKVLLCAIKRQQIGQLKTLVAGVDKNAFVIVSEAHEVLGFGFKEHALDG